MDMASHCWVQLESYLTVGTVTTRLGDRMDTEGTYRADNFCGSNGGADIGVFGMMSSVILTVQLIINIINAGNRGDT